MSFLRNQWHYSCKSFSGSKETLPLRPASFGSLLQRSLGGRFFLGVSSESFSASSFYSPFPHLNFLEKLAVHLCAAIGMLFAKVLKFLPLEWA